VRAAQSQKDRADDDHAEHAPGVKGVKQAHILLGMLRGNGGHHGADQHLAKTRRDGEQHRARQKPCVGVLGEQPRNERVDEQTRRGQKRHGAHRVFDIEIFGEEAENEVDRQLGAEIDADQRAEQGVGDAVHLAEGHKQKGRQAEDGRHRKIGEKAGPFGAGVIWRWHGTPRNNDDMGSIPQIARFVNR